MLTQVGGVILLLVLILVRRPWLRLSSFIGVYLLSVLLIVPFLARLSGRQPISVHTHLRPVSYVTVLTNRHYVRPGLNDLLLRVSDDLAERFPELELQYMDANFPFFDGFPLLPHLSHNDGRKVDLAFFFRDENGNRTNRKPAWLGYGGYVEPGERATHTAQRCKEAGYWFYDITRLLDWKRETDLMLDEDATSYLFQLLLAESQVVKIFLEPHLKTRLGLTSDRVRFHGCHSVRHDDHIHVEIRK